MGIMTSVSYEDMLKRALSSLPRKPLQSERLKIPSADVIVVGNRTLVRNFREIASIINRDPEHLLKFLCKEAGSAGTLKDDIAEIHGRFDRSTLNKLIERYVQNFVLCKVCMRPDTHLKKYGRFLYIECDACGASSPIISR
ncbi:translation initiation factor IF-2 subunit beta [Candidatus Bathyarchaeota archaeon]|nr:translation initiation factor IF-2 subunit beta [Candidatus Bathyarchaeota archaeon]MBS7617838.1 translation initiation factor IF-2 subunit beta [Candidatus Bathyarchaeota archaeon]